MLIGILLFLAFCIGCSQSGSGGSENQAGPEPDISTKSANKIKSARVPFIENQGQKNENVLFYSGTFGGTVYVTRDGQIVYILPKYEENEDHKFMILKETIPDWNVGNIKGENESITKINYFKGNDRSKWITNAPTYDMVNLGEIATGIELKLKAHGDNVEKLFFVKPGADPNDIRINMSGENYLSTNENGELEAATDLGPVLFTKPVAYQEKDGIKTYVDVDYDVNGKEYGFVIDN